MNIPDVMSRYLILSRNFGIVLTGALLTACQPTANVQSNLNFNPPERIMQVRAIDRTQLSPTVKLSNGATIPMTKTGDNSWSGSINVQPNNEYFVSIEWIEALPEGNLVLAQWAQNVQVDSDGTEVVLSDANYNYNLDRDGDQITNIQERENDTNPFVHNDQTETLTDIGVTDSDGSLDVGTTDSTAGTTAGSDGNSGTTSESTDGSSDTSGDLGSTSTAETTDDGNTTSGNEDDDGDDGSSDTHMKASVLIPRIATTQAPFIDGRGVFLNSQDNLTGEWADAVQFDDAGARLWIKNLMIDKGADSEDGAELRRWAAMHDGQILYVLVLSDDVGARQSDSPLFWDDDSLELFIDGDNSKLTEWFGSSDFHEIIPLLKRDSTQANNEINGRFEPGPGTVDNPLSFEFSTGPGIGPDGIRLSRWEQDVYELAIPFSSAGIVTGLPIGFELQLNDDDDGGSRDSKWGWYHPSRENDDDTDRTYLDPSVMGIVVLEE